MSTTSDQDRTIEMLTATTMDVSKPAPDGSVLATCGMTGSKFRIDEDGGYSLLERNRLNQLSDQEVIVIEQALDLLAENVASSSDPIAAATLARLRREFEDENMGRMMAEREVAAAVTRSV